MQNADAEHAKHILDAVSILTVVGALVDILPSIAALITIVWTSIRIWETKTVQAWVQRKRNHGH